MSQYYTKEQIDKFMKTTLPNIADNIDKEIMKEALDKIKERLADVKYIKPIKK